MAHDKFEQGSWAVIDFIVPDDFFVGSWNDSTLGRAEAQGQKDLFRCACCNQKITWRVVVERLGADGKGTDELAVLGRACAAKAGLPGVPASAKAMQVEVAQRLLRGSRSNPEFTRWASALPHPKHRGSSLLDEANYWASRKPEVVFAIVRRFETEGPLPANDLTAPALQLGRKGAARIEVRLGWTRFHRLTGKVWAARITGTDPQFGLKRVFVEVRERGAEGHLAFLTNVAGIYQLCSAQTRYLVELAADGTVRELTFEEVEAALKPAAVPGVAPLAAILAVAIQARYETQHRELHDWLCERVNSGQPVPEAVEDRLFEEVTRARAAVKALRGEA